MKFPLFELVTLAKVMYELLFTENQEHLQEGPGYFCCPCGQFMSCFMSSTIKTAKLCLTETSNSLNTQNGLKRIHLKSLRNRITQLHDALERRDCYIHCYL